MGLGWAKSKNSEIKELASELPMVWLGRISKPSDSIILPTVAADNQPVPYSMGGANNRKFSGDGLDIGLKISSCVVVFQVMDVNGDNGDVHA